MLKQGFVYIMSNVHHTTLYIGVTSDLKRRVAEHKNQVQKGFTQAYNLGQLIYWEAFVSIETAIERETQ